MTTNAEKQTPAMEAINHILRRCQTDPDFAWHMMGTESFRLCCIAAAEATGRDESELRAAVEVNVVKMQKKKKTRIEQLEREIARLSAMNDSASDSADSVVEPLNSISDLINYCRLRSETPTLDALESALDGKSLALCLGELS